MLESSFAALRERLESSARPPVFEEIRIRRTARTRRIAITTTALATVLALAIASAAAASLRGTHQPPQVPTGTTPSVPSTSTSPSSAEPGAVAPELTALAAAPSGALFALSDRCVASCSDTPQHEQVLLRSDDLSAHWSEVGVVTGGPAGQPAHLFVIDQTHLWLANGGAVAGSIDGGSTWHWSNLGAGGDAGGHDVTGSASGATGWFAWGSDVWVATNGGTPTRTAAAPPGVEIRSLVAITTTKAYALVDSAAESATWYATRDKGRHWAVVADPCRGTRFSGSSFSSMRAAPNGTLWGICASEPGGGQMPKDLVISTDGGTSWTSAGQLESEGYGTEVWPVSATTAWRTGGRADIYRTTDGRHWSDVGGLYSDGPSAFAAIDAETAVYAYGAPYPEMRIFLTRDGGATWAWHRFG